MISLKWCKTKCAANWVA